MGSHRADARVPCMRLREKRRAHTGSSGGIRERGCLLPRQGGNQSVTVMTTEDPRGGRMSGEPGALSMWVVDCPEGAVIPTETRSADAVSLREVAEGAIEPVAPVCTGNTTKRTVSDTLAECCAMASPCMPGTTSTSRSAARVLFPGIAVLSRLMSESQSVLRRPVQSHRAERRTCT